jgi:hypothetical protein
VTINNSFLTRFQIGKRELKKTLEMKGQSKKMKNYKYKKKNYKKKKKKQLD